MTAPLEPPLYKVRIEIPHLSGTRGWSAAATAFEQGVATHTSLLVTARQIELLTRQGRDYVRLSATVEAGNVAEAAVVAWAVLQQAMSEDADGWDIAGTSAEIRPARSSRNARLPLAGRQISAISRFDNATLPPFGLPRTLVDWPAPFAAMTLLVTRLPAGRWPCRPVRVDSTGTMRPRPAAERAERRCR